jgi:hypothetical protein
MTFVRDEREEKKGALLKFRVSHLGFRELFSLILILLYFITRLNNTIYLSIYIHVSCVIFLHSLIEFRF